MGWAHFGPGSHGLNPGEPELAHQLAKIQTPKPKIQNQNQMQVKLLKDQAQPKFEFVWFLIRGNSQI